MSQSIPQGYGSPVQFHGLPMQVPMGGAPRPGYEFNEIQNRDIKSLARAMGFVGALMMIGGGAFGLVGVGQVVSSTYGGAAEKLVQGFLYLLLGYWTWRASGSFTNIVKTQGNDIENLMKALGDLRRIYNFQRVAFIAIMAIVAVLFVIGFVAGLAGLSMGHR